MTSSQPAQSAPVPLPANTATASPWGRNPSCSLATMRSWIVATSPLYGERSFSGLPSRGLAGSVAVELAALKLPGGETPKVDVELVQAAPVVLLELNLELHLGLGDTFPADRALGINAWAAPCPVRCTGRELPGLDRGSGLLSEDRFVGHGRAFR